MDKKVIILVVGLGLLVIFWIPIMTNLGLVEPPARQPLVQDSLSVIPDTAANSPELIPPTPVTSDATIDQPSEMLEEKTGEPVAEDSIIVETNIQTFVLSNYGGAAKSITLKDYKYIDGEPIQLLPDCQKATPELHYSNGTFNANDLIYTPTNPIRYYTVTDGDLELTYTYSGPEGGEIIKKYRFYADKYEYDLTIQLNNRTAFGFERRYTLEWNNKLNPTELKLSDDYNSFWAMAMLNDQVKFDDYDNNAFNQSLEGITYWTATRSKYFTAILIPRSKFAAGVEASGKKIDNGEYTSRELTTGLIMDLPYQDNVTDSFTVFIGPIDYEMLKKYDNKVTDLVDIGTTPVVGWLIKIFAIPIMWLLPRMYEIIPNYGFVIIIFALFVKLITWPLTRKTIKSMSAMKELQPKMKELQKKHKNNPQALNKEMMKMYKEVGVNPLSGCLPYLPQMPLFFALFAVFRSTILLRQAPFILWWDDLSRGALAVSDPYIILVVLMVGLMFLQQKMMMTDPKNKALMYIMPVMMGFFFYSVSAGLILYWTSFSLFSFLEQLLFKRNKPKTEVVT